MVNCNYYERKCDGSFYNYLKFEFKTWLPQRCWKNKNCFALFTLNENLRRISKNCFGIWMQMSSCYLRQCKIVSHSM